MKYKLLTFVLGLAISGYSAAQDYQKYATTPHGSNPYFDAGFGSNGDIRIDSIASGRKWGGPIGTGAIISYSFPTAKSVWADDYNVNGRNEPSTLIAFNDAERRMMRDAMDLWEEAGNIKFVEVQETPTQVGDIRIAWTLWKPNPGAWASVPGYPSLSKGGYLVSY